MVSGGLFSQPNGRYTRNRYPATVTSPDRVASDRRPALGPARPTDAQRKTTGIRRIEFTIVDGVTTGSLSNS
jgi:hypothetical protein